MFQESVNTQYRNVLDISVTSKCAHRQRILNTFIRCRNRAREAGDEFEYFNIPPQLDNLNAEFSKIQFLDSMSDYETLGKSPSSDSDDYSWSSDEIADCQNMMPDIAATGSNSACSRTVVFNRTNCDAVPDSKQDTLTPPMLKMVNGVCCLSKSNCSHESSMSSSSNLDHSATGNAWLDVQQNIYQRDIRSPNRLKRSCKHYEIQESPRKVPKATGFENRNEKTSLKGDPDRHEDVLRNEISPSNSNVTIEESHKRQEEGDLFPMFTKNKDCFPEVTRLQNFPSNHPDLITEYGSLLCQNVYDGHSLATNETAMKVNHLDNSEQTSSSMQFGCIEGCMQCSHNIKLQNAICTIKR